MIAASALAIVPAPSDAQVRVMNYNVAQLQGNLNDLQSVIAAAHADDKSGFAVPVGVFVFQEVLSANVVTLQSIINASAPPGIAYALATYTNNNEDDYAGAQAMFYRTDLLSEIPGGHVDIYTGAGRRADRWRLQLNGYASPAASFYLFSAHLKSSLGFENERLSGAQAIRTNADALGPGQNIIYAGDWNLYANTEPAYVHFLSAGNGRAIDPIGIGSWSGAANSIKQSQSPRLNSSAVLVGGGVDDRFDFQLSTIAAQDGAGLTLMSVPFVYRSLGNDGAHYNQSINNGNNTYYAGDLVRSNTLADALFDASDHLPIIADYQVPAKMAGTLAPSFGRVIQGATHSVTIGVTNPAPVHIAMGGDVLDFTATGSMALSGWQNGSVEPLNDPAVVSLPLNTTVVGGATARVTLASSSQGVQPASLVLDSTGTIIRHANASFAAGSDVNSTTVSAAFVADSGSHIISAAVYNFGFDALQASLDLDSVGSLSGPFAFVNGLATGVGATPATLNFSFDSDGRAPGDYQAQATINVSDENLPGEAASSLALIIHITVTSAGCPADINSSGNVDVNDLLAVITAWGACPSPPAACLQDIDHDGLVNVNDLLGVIAAWGACP